MKELKFRKLKADEIECRVGQTNESGFSLLLYKDARVDMNLLDEVVGPAKWQRKHYMLGNDIYCSVGIYYDDIGWVWKDDAGASGSIEIEKSKASDSFKRACVNATGVGRELYTSPFIWIKKDQDNDPKKSHYFVKEIDYKDNEISKLVICNEKTGAVVFSLKGSTNIQPQAQKVPQNTNQDNNQLIATADMEYLQDYIGSLGGEQYNNFFVWLEKQFGTRNVGNLTEQQGKKVVAILRRK